MGQPQITASSLNETLETVPKEKVIFAAAGGALYKGVGIRGVVVVDKSLLTDSEMKAIDSTGFPEEALLLNSFIEAPCIVAEGHIVRRRMLVNYVANALGGTHYDKKRRRKKTGVLFSMLDRAANRFQYEDKNLVYFELLAVGQAIASAGDVNAFCDKVGV